MNLHQLLLKVISLLTIILSTYTIHAQSSQNKTTRVLFIVDGSSSMLEHWNGDFNRFKAGSFLIRDIMDSIESKNPDVQFALRVFGHNYTVEKNNCYDTKIETNFAGHNSDLLFGRLSLLNPQGVSPIALSLKESAMLDITQTNKYAYSIILVTDGNESCGGDLCEVMRKLINSQITFKPYIISLNNDKSLVNQYDCMGEFMIVSQPSDFKSVISKILADNDNFIYNKSNIFTPQDSYNQDILKELQSNVDKNDTLINTPPPTRQISTSKNIQKFNNFPKPKLNYQGNPFSSAKFRQIVALPKFNLKTETEPDTAPKPEVNTPKKTYKRVQLLSTKGFALEKQNTSLTKMNFSKRTIHPLPAFNLEVEEPKKFVQIKKNTHLASRIQPLPLSKNSLNVNLIKTNPLPSFNLVVEKPTPPPPTKVEPEKPQYISLTNEKVKPQDQKTTVKTEEKENALDPGTMQIYITNGKGKYYNSSPKMNIKDNATGKIVFDGVRDISQSNPKPISLPDGEYTITFKESGRTSKVIMEKGKNKRVEIVVGNGNIAFIYTGTNEVPKGYVATVSKRFENGDIITHPSEIKLEYDPSNYHIEINTLPILMYNVDVDADGLVLVNIPKPGTIQILNEEELGRIEFWHILAGQTYRFHEMSIFGDVEYQKVELRPGKYEIRYPFVTENGEKVMKVKSINLSSKEELKLTLN